MKILNHNLIYQINQEILLNTNEEREFYSKVECYDIEPEDISMYQNETFENGPLSSMIGTSPNSFMTNPVYDFVSYASSLEFPALKAALCTSFPDYIFHDVCPWNFRLNRSLDQIKSKVSWNVATFFSNPEKFLNIFWDSLNKLIHIPDAQIFSYEPDGPDALSEMGILTHLTLFFLDDSKKRIVFFHTSESQNGIRSLSDTESQSMENLFENRYGFGVY